MVRDFNIRIKYVCILYISDFDFNLIVFVKPLVLADVMMGSKETTGGELKEPGDQVQVFT